MLSKPFTHFTGICFKPIITLKQQQKKAFTSFYTGAILFRSERDEASIKKTHQTTAAQTCQMHLSSLSETVTPLCCAQHADCAPSAFPFLHTQVNAAHERPHRPVIRENVVNKAFRGEC